MAEYAFINSYCPSVLRQGIELHTLHKKGCCKNMIPPVTVPAGCYAFYVNINNLRKHSVVELSKSIVSLELFVCYEPDRALPNRF